MQVTTKRAALALTASAFVALAACKREKVDSRPPCTGALASVAPAADWKTWSVEMASSPSAVKRTKVGDEDTTALYLGSLFFRHATAKGATAPLRIERGDCKGNTVDVPLEGGRTLEMLEHLTLRSKGSAWVASDDRTGFVFASLAAH
jgi:hypothetical protein